MKLNLTKAIFISFLTACCLSEAADFRDFLQRLKSSSTNQTGSATSLGALSQDEIVRGLKEALNRGVQQAVANLGKDGGFLNNLTVKIPMPPQLQQVEKGLRMMRQDKMADDFVATMNRAAERAVPVAAPILASAVSQMSIADAQGIHKGPNDAATQFFKKTCSPQLTGKFRPVVEKATAEVGVTGAYKNLMTKAGPMAGFLNKESTDLDGYVTQKGLDGLFFLIAKEEEQIRQNPAARASDLLKKVFGAK